MTEKLCNHHINGHVWRWQGASGGCDADAVDHDGADEVSCDLLSVQVATKPIGHDGSVSMIL